MEVDPDPNVVAEQRKAAGNEAYKLGDFPKAIELYSSAIDLTPSNPLLYTNRAIAYMALKQFKKGLEDCLKAQELDPTNSKAAARAAKCYLSIGNIFEAQRQYEIALKLEPNNTTAKQELASISQFEQSVKYSKQSLASKDYSRALFNLEQAFQISPQSVALQLLKAEAYIGQKNFGEALNLANNLMRDDGNNPDAFYLKGQVYYQQGQNDKAKIAFSEALRVDPDHSSSRIALKRVKELEKKKEDGNAAFKAGDYTAAYQLYSEALNVDPDNKSTNAKLFSNRANVNQKLNKLAEAIADCSKAIELEPDYVKAYLRRAELHMKMENYQEAVYDYEKAKDLDSSNREVLNALRNAKLELKKSQRKDYYKLLGVTKSADENEIKRAYRKMALQWHPDKFTDEAEKQQAEAKFKDLNEANAVLSDPQKRARYDAGSDLDEGGGGGPDVDMQDVFTMFMNGHGGGGFRGGGGFPGGFPGGFGGFPGDDDDDAGSYRGGSSRFNSRHRSR